MQIIPKNFVILLRRFWKLHFFENSPLLGDTERYVPRIVVYIVPRQTKNRNNYDNQKQTDSGTMVQDH